MTAAAIAFKCGINRDTAHSRLKKLGYKTGLGVEYDTEVLNDIMYFVKSYDTTKRKPNHSNELEIFAIFCGQIENSIDSIARELNLPKHRVNAVIDRILDTGCVIVESKMNRTTL